MSSFQRQITWPLQKKKKKKKKKKKNIYKKTIERTGDGRYLLASNATTHATHPLLRKNMLNTISPYLLSQIFLSGQLMFVSVKLVKAKKITTK